MIQALPSQRFHRTLREDAGLRGLDRSLADPHSLSGEPLIEGTAELGVPVANEKLRVGRAPPDGEVAGLLGYRGRVPVGRHTQQVDPPRGRLDGKKDVEGFQAQRFFRQKVAGWDAAGPGVQERRPRRAVATRCWPQAECLSTFATVVADTVMPSLASSPRRRW